MKKEALKPNRLIVAGAMNLGYGVVEGIAAFAEGSLALGSATNHEVGDAIVHGSKGVAENLHDPTDMKRIKRLRIAFRSLLCTSALSVGLIAAHEASLGDPEELGGTAVKVALGGLAVNGVVAAMLYGRRKDSGFYADGAIHALTDVASAAITVVATHAATKGYPVADEYGAMAASAVTIWYNRPWNVTDHSGHSH